jgi:sterol desaturase/sphingolipid hydroxylase (fatty acid hydroxylase superfamily)
MEVFSLEHSKVAYRADFAVYGLAVVLLAAFALLAGPPDERYDMAGLALLGLASWTAIEYALHRFVLHGVQPFSRWHAEHHQRPRALICTPTVFSAMLIATLVFLPALLLGNLWRACGLTLGVLVGYLAYTVTHHATHHWRADSAWLKERKRWHALHHHPVEREACFGVTTGFWDRVFGTTHVRAARANR